MLKRSRVRHFVFTILIGFLCGEIMVALLITGVINGIEYKSIDFRFLCRGTIPINDKIVIIATDEDALDKIKDPFIFWSPYFAEIIKAVAKGGAQVIGLDFLQTIALQKNVGGEDLDAIMTDALIEAENVVMINLLRWNEATSSLTAVNPLPRYQYASDPDNLGFSNLTIDNDGCVRRQVLLLDDAEGAIYAYFGLKVIAKYFGSIIEKKGNSISVGSYSIPVSPYNEMIINFAGPSGTFPTMSFYNILKMARQGNTEFFKKYFKDKIVLIGPGNIYSQDFKPTPYYSSQYYTGTRQTLGVEIVANVINTILERRFIIPLKLWQSIFIILFLGVLISFVTSKLSPIFSGITALAIAAGYICLGIFLFNRYGLLLNLVHSAGVVPLSYTAVLAYRFTIENKEKRKIKKIFKRYVSEEVVEELLQYPEEVSLGGNRAEVSVLFADIRDFTSLSENRDPQYIVTLLNSYFTAMADIVIKHKGTLDKYMGDEILAFYGAPVSRAEHADLAVSSAIEMLSTLDILNKELALENPLRIGIGIHSGEVIVGNIGSKLRMEYTVIGDTVNTASRVEKLTKKAKTNILITEETFSRLNGRYNISQEIKLRLRGKAKPIMLYRVENTERRI